jgi:hypothetical protein
MTMKRRVETLVFAFVAVASLLTQAFAYSSGRVSVGPGHRCAMRNDGTLACWGANILGQATPPSGSFTQVTAGSRSSVSVGTGTPRSGFGSDLGTTNGVTAVHMQTFNQGCETMAYANPEWDIRPIKTGNGQAPRVGPLLHQGGMTGGFTRALLLS